MCLIEQQNQYINNLNQNLDAERQYYEDHVITQKTPLH